MVGIRVEWRVTCHVCLMKLFCYLNFEVLKVRLVRITKMFVGLSLTLQPGILKGQMSPLQTFSTTICVPEGALEGLFQPHVSGDLY